MICPPDHAMYPSETVANNAVILHKMKVPECWAITAFACGDHFHIGHSTWIGKSDCKRAEVPMARDTARDNLGG